MWLPVSNATRLSSHTAVNGPSMETAFLFKTTVAQLTWIKDELTNLLSPLRLCGVGSKKKTVFRDHMLTISCHPFIAPSLALILHQTADSITF